MNGVIGRVWIVSVTVRVPDLSIGSVDHKFCTLPDAELPTVADCLPLSWANENRPLGTVSHYGPLVAARNNMVSFNAH